jgi:hypothetical protein
MKTQKIILKYLDKEDREIESEIKELVDFIKKIDLIMDKALTTKIKYKIIDEDNKVTLKDECKIKDLDINIQKIKNKYG